MSLRQLMVNLEQQQAGMCDTRPHSLSLLFGSFILMNGHDMHIYLTVMTGVAN
jgi:hypothetical protein